MIQVLNPVASTRSTRASNFKFEGLSSRMMFQCQNPEDHSLNSYGHSLYAI